MNEKIANLKKAYEKKGFIFDYFTSKEEAVEKVLAEVPAGKRAAFGGSISLKELGLYEGLKGKGVDVVWHWEKDYDNPLEEARKADYYFSSANALTETGEILNIDGTGNRLSALCYGHKKIFIIVGTNKLTKNEEEGWKRAREVAAPKNAQRFDIKTPCKKTGKCSDCDSPDRICKVFLKIDRPTKPTPIHVILIEGEYGY
ncbi:MAG: LUD domain-containing protein [Tissierellia bacterium]|nr:LUD domain-containing protein [Tissierellia bacterium]